MKKIERLTEFSAYAKIASKNVNEFDIKINTKILENNIWIFNGMD